MDYQQETTVLPLMQDKLELIDFVFSNFDARSFADLGGVWGVEGGYTFYPLAKYNITTAKLVDTHPTPMVNCHALNYPQLEVIKGNFSSESIARRLKGIDVVFLFDVLLHQVAPDWGRVLEIYAPHTKGFVIFNQQWIGSPHTVRLLDLGEEEYFSNVPHDRTLKPYQNLFEKLDEKHPDHDRPWRDVHHIWQWGITDRNLLDKMNSLGFRLQYMKNCGQFGRLANFENHAFFFTR